MHRFVLLLTCVATIACSAMAGEPTQRQPDPNRGLYAIWAKPEQQKLPLVKGGQICRQWKEVQPEADRYDFAPLDAALAEMHKAGRPTTVQINGNLRPDFLFQRVPHHPEKLSVQVRDKQGTLMFWHPNHVKAYLGLLEAYGRRLRESPYRSIVVGVRLNFNAIGTEHMFVEPAYRDLDQWITPPGVEPGTAWTREAADEYRQAVIAAFIKNFTPEVTVFVRNNVAIDWALAEHFQAGRLGLFHTSSEVEPRSRGTEKQYLAFLQYARPGKTLAYAESWADAWGRHGGKTDPRWCSPCQWNYWRLLVDLHCGVSFIGVYGSDLRHAAEPEFEAAFQFARRYAGYHASPSVAPGAWVALREGNFLKGDYTFLMERLDGDASRPVEKAGPEDQRYGAWARVIPAGGRARFRLDDRFAASLDSDATVRVVYLDEGRGEFRVNAAGVQLAVPMKDSGRWQVAETVIPSGSFRRRDQEADVTVTTPGDLTLHMIEVVRGK